MNKLQYAPIRSTSLFSENFQALLYSYFVIIVWKQYFMTISNAKDCPL